MNDRLERDLPCTCSIGWPGILRLALLAWYCMSLNLHAFEPPAADARRAAIGPLDSLSPVLRAALEPDSDFRPIPKPGPDDWLSSHREVPQTFLDFERSSPRQPDATRRVIYLLPLGDFPAGRSPPLDKLQRFAAAYFQMEVKILPVTTGTNFTTRLNPNTKNRQILTVDVLRFLQARLPTDAFCVLAITMDDLYPDPSWNFVFGQASLHEGVGVFSFARYDPAFYGQQRGSDHESVLLRRSCKVLVHETGHMFGVSHCVFFACVMNGSNHLGESDSRPFHLCPVCLRKLQWSVKWDLVKRDESLAALYHEFGFERESNWTKARLTKMKAAQ
jgi:archaemetzincin